MAQPIKDSYEGIKKEEVVVILKDTTTGIETKIDLTRRKINE
jgi:hypothetical protein